MVRPKQRPQQHLEDEEQVVDDPSPISPESTPAAEPAKKRHRVSKKDVPDYKFSAEQQVQVAEFIKEHPPLYDKKDAQWLDPKHKEDLWKELAAYFPDCHYLQVRKFFEAKRTDFGKIEKRESKSGAPRRHRTPRERLIMETWSFLGGHIAHEPTTPSERFTPPLASQEEVEVIDSDESGLSAHSLVRRRREKAASPPSPPRDETVVRDLLSRANTLMSPPQVLDPNEREIAQFMTFLTTHMRDVPRSNFSELFCKMIQDVKSFKKEVEVEPRQQRTRRTVEQAGASTSSAAPGASTSSAAAVPPPPPPPPPVSPWPANFGAPAHQFPQQYFPVPYQYAAPPTPQPVVQQAPPSTTAYPTLPTTTYSPVKFAEHFAQSMTRSPSLHTPKMADLDADKEG